jgi:hypothetical protein
MSLHKALKNGGNEFPFHDITMMHVRGENLTVFFKSGKFVEGWCSLAKAQKRLQANGIEMLKTKRCFLISYSVIECVDKKRKLKLKPEFFQQLPARWKEMLADVTLTAAEKKIYDTYIIKNGGRQAKPIPNMMATHYSAISCTDETMQQMDIHYIYTEQHLSVIRAFTQLLSSNGSSNK